MKFESTKTESLTHSQAITSINTKKSTATGNLRKGITIDIITRPGETAGN